MVGRRDLEGGGSDLFHVKAIRRQPQGLHCLENDVRFHGRLAYSKHGYLRAQMSWLENADTERKLPTHIRDWSGNIPPFMQLAYSLPCSRLCTLSCCRLIRPCPHTPLLKLEFSIAVLYYAGWMADESGFHSRWTWQRILLFSTASRPGLGPIQCVPEALSPELERQACDADE
jgi:hypothetical protein